MPCKRRWGFSSPFYRESTEAQPVRNLVGVLRSSQFWAAGSRDSPQCPFPVLSGRSQGQSEQVGLKSQARWGKTWF